MNCDDYNKVFSAPTISTTLTINQTIIPQKVRDTKWQLIVKKTNTKTLLFAVILLENDDEIDRLTGLETGETLHTGETLDRRLLRGFPGMSVDDLALTKLPSHSSQSKDHWKQQKYAYLRNNNSKVYLNKI